MVDRAEVRLHAARLAKDDVVLDVAVTVALLLVAFVCVFPLLFVISVSLTPMSEMLKRGGFAVLPRKMDLEAYKRIVTQSQIPNGFVVTVSLTVIGTTINLLLTSTLAYPLSVSGLPGRRMFLFYVVFTMLFSGGLIPTYMVVKGLGILNTFWAMILPSAVWSSNVILMRLFFEQLPKELFESARLDGAGEAMVLRVIVIPLSLPAFATIGLFYGVSHWNQFLDAIIYVTDSRLYPLQLIIRSIILETERIETSLERVVPPTMAFRMAAVVLACVPIIMVYPFLQRFFVKGLTVGAVKG